MGIRLGREDGSLIAVEKRPDVEGLVEQVLVGATPEESKALLDALLSGRVSSLLEKLDETRAPTLLPTPTQVRGFRVRLDHGRREAARLATSRAAG